MTGRDQGSLFWVSPAWREPCPALGVDGVRSRLPPMGVCGMNLAAGSGEVRLGATEWRGRSRSAAVCTVEETMRGRRGIVLWSGVDGCAMAEVYGGGLTGRRERSAVRPGGGWGRWGPERGRTADPGMPAGQGAGCGIGVNGGITLERSGKVEPGMNSAGGERRSGGCRAEQGA